jgi:hypothetical protein
MGQFENRVLEWVKKQLDGDAVVVLTVIGRGSDWAGDTEGGFYTEFEVTIRYRLADGTVKHRDITGEDMGSLWAWTVGEYERVTSLFTFPPPANH